MLPCSRECQARHQASCIVRDGVWCSSEGIDDGLDQISSKVRNYRLLQVVRTPLYQIDLQPYKSYPFSLRYVSWSRC